MKALKRLVPFRTRSETPEKMTDKQRIILKGLCESSGTPMPDREMTRDEADEMIARLSGASEEDRP